MMKRGIRRSRSSWIESNAQLRALSSPVRQEIVDLLVASGPLPIADIAACLGRAADSLYFHVRQLRACGLIAEGKPQKRGRHVALRYDVSRRPLRIRPDLASRPIVERVMRAAIRLGSRDMSRAVLRGDARTSGSARTLWSGRFRGWVSPRELRRINRCLHEILHMLAQRRPARGRALQSFTFVLAPTPPSRRASLVQQET